MHFSPREVKRVRTASGPAAFAVRLDTLILREARNP